MKQRSLLCFIVCTFLTLSLYAMFNQNNDQNTLQENREPNPASSLSRMTMNNQRSFKKKWVCKNPYDNNGCNGCRGYTCTTTLAVGGGCTIIKGLDALLTSCIPRMTCSDVCSVLWFPTGYDNCHYSGDICCSTFRWIVTLSMIATPIVGTCAYNPCCNENGIHCCCQKIDVSGNDTLHTQPIEMNEHN